MPLLGAAGAPKAWRLLRGSDGQHDADWFGAGAEASADVDALAQRREHAIIRRGAPVPARSPAPRRKAVVMDARGFDALTLALASAWSRRALLPLAGTLIAPGFGRADRASAARRRHRHCPAGTTRCGRACVDLATDHDHCGACAVACAPDATCQQGGCVTGGPCIFLCVICHACRAGRCEPEPDGTPCGSGQVCLAGACGPVRDPAPCAATGPSGIAGQVLLGPMCPVQQLGHPCPDQPFAAMLRIEGPAGRLDCTTRSGEDGTFRAALPPGDYLVAPVDPSPESPPHGRPERVTVALDQYVAVTIHFDSGIR